MTNNSPIVLISDFEIVIRDIFWQKFLSYNTSRFITAPFNVEKKG